ncbi:MAG: hypothetical protein NTW25_05790 [Candidatus Kapabacteria bacterium]|jgi:hypothetical protein|nr:hypothetical protein [Candidatus Kapabacteria bacterium]
MENKLMTENQNTEKRRNFFKYLGASAISTSVLGFLSFKLSDKTKIANISDDKKIKVSIHPSAVKRG